MKDSNNVNVLYNTLRKDGYTDLGTLSDFGFNLTDTNNRKALYATLKKDGYTDLGDFSDFETNLGYAPLDDDPVAKAKKDATSWMESMQPKKMEEFFTEKVETPKRLPSRPKDFGRDFYDELKKTGIDNLGDYSSFQARMADPDNRKALYETMKAQGRWSADYDDLDKYIQYTMVPQEKIDDGIKYEKEWFGLDMARRLDAGLAEMFSGAFGLLDKGASTVQDGVNAVNRFIGLPEEQGGLFRDIADYFKEGAEINRALSNRYGQDNYASLWEKGDYAGAFGDVMLNATESIPMSVAAMVATYCGVPAAGLVGIGSVTASQKYDQLNEEHPEMSYAAKMINASLTGLAEGGSEMLGAGVSKVWMSALYKRFGKDAAEDMVRRGVLGYLKSASRRYGIFFEPIEEGLEEVSSQFAENVTDKFTGADPNRKISDGLMDSFVYGVGGGMQFSAAHLPSYVSHKGWREQWDPTTRDLERMQNQYDIAEAAQNPGSVRSAGQEMANAAAQLDAADENTQQLAGQYRDASKGERESLLNSLTDEKQKLTLEAYWNAYDNVQALADNAEMQARAAVRQDFNDNVKPYITSIPELNNGEKSVVTATLNSRGGDQQVRVKSMDAHTAVIFDESAPNGMREVLRSQLSNISASNVNDLYQESLNKAREEQKKKLEWQYMHNAKTEAPRQGLVVYNGNQAFLLQGQNQNGDWMAVTAVVDSKSGQIVPAKNATPIQMTEAEVLQLQDSYYDAQENGGTAPTQQGASQGQTTSAQQEQTAGSTQTMDNQSQPTAQPTTTEAAPQESALSRIPKDEKGRPIYEQADPNTTFDAIVEQTNGNEEMAQQIAEEMVKDKEAELKKAEKAAAKSGTTIEKKIAAKQAVETAKAEFEYWQNVANVQNNRVTNVTEDTKNAENQINPEATSEQIDNSTELNVEPTTETSIEESSPGNTPTLRDVVNILYTKGKAYASKMFERSFFNVVKTPDFMKALGLSGEIFTIKYGVISRHFSKDGSHNFTEAEWEQLPSALEKPFAIARLDDKKNGYRLYTSLKNSKGEYVVVGVDVKNAGRDIEVNAISTIFGRRSDANLPLNEQVIYRSKEITPDQEALLGRPNSDQYPTERELSTDKNNDSSENNQTKSEENSSVGNTQTNEARTEGGEQTNAPTESNQKRKDTAEPTRRQKLSPEKRKAVERIAKRLGTSVTWVDTMEDNGTYDSETKNIRIAMDAENPLVEVFGHESLHRIKELGGKSYSQLRDALKAFEGEEAWASRMDEIRNRYEGSFDGMNLTDEEINAYYEEEAVADALGEMINNREMVTELANRMDHGVLAKIRDILNEMIEAIEKAFGKKVPEEVQRIKDLKKVIDRAYMEAKKNAQMEAQKPQPGTRQSKRKKVSNNIFDIAEEKIKAREENSESSAPIVREQKAGETKPTHAEQVLRDVVIDHLRKSGMDVITDQEEGQRVLDMANGEDVRMNAKKRRALETASVSRREEHQPTVVSSADGAKILKDLDEQIDRYEKLSNQSKTFIGDVAKALAATRDNSKSEYATFETKNGNVVTIRIANHNATVSNFDNRGEQEGISIVISPKENTGITNDGNAHITEYYYDAIKLRKAEGKPLAEIVKSIKQALYSGEFKDTTGLAETQEVNANEADAKITDHVRYFRTAKGDAYGFTVNGKIYIDPRIANAETPIHEYTHLWATALRQGNPKEWQNVVQLMKGTKEWDEVKKLYPELESEDAIADEVLAQYSGKRGAERLRAEARKIAEGKGSVMEAAEAITALQKIKQAVDKFWRGVADFLGIHFTTAEEVADRVMKDLLDGVDPRKFGKEEGLRLNQIKSATDNVGTFDASNDDIRYQFMGEKGAAAIDHAEEVTTRLDNLSIARSMEEAKKDAKAIKMATGWERGADGKWRYEIPDSKMNDMLDVDGKGTMVKRSEEDMLWNGGKLGEYVVAPELFKAYPELKEIKLDTDTIVDDLDNGSYNPDTRTITIHAYDLKALNSILNHEIQHAIQHIEGFAQGGNAEMYVDKERVSELKERRSVIEEEIANGNYDNEEELQNIEMELFDLEEDMPFYKYRHLSGEVEARNVQKRMRMTDEERRNSLASETEDVSREDQIFLFGDGGESMAMSHEQQAANERFNSELTRYQNGEMDKNEILHLGRPQGVMRAFLPNLPIVMRQRVIKKGSEKKHEVDVSAIRDMPQHLSSPIFVFQRSEDTIGVLTDMRDRNGKNVCVAIELKRQMQQGAEYLEVNDVRSFHGREFKNIVEPIANNKTLKWVDKEKGLAYLSSASQPVQQEIDKQVLDTAAKVVKDFANPNISDENVAGEGKTLLDSIELNKIAEDRKKMYDSVLSGNFDDVTLQQIDNYIDNVTPNNRYWRPLSQRLPSGVERGMRKGERTSAVDVLFSRISESAVPANERTGADAKRRIEEKKKELLKGWAIATGNWHTDISDFTDAKEPMGSGKDSDVYQSKDGHSVIKVSKGKEHLKKFRPDIDAVALFNHLFPNSHYEILGYGEIDGKFVKFLKQPIVDFTNSTPLTVDERVDYMAKLGFKPINEEKTAFSNGTIIAADVQGNNIVRDSAGNIRVIDADVKLHTKDIGGEYSYPAVETDTMLHQDNSQENSSRPTRRSIRKKPTANAFDQAEEVVRFRDEAKASAVVGGTDNMVVVEKKIGAAKEQYERTLRTASYQVQEALQDSLLSLKVLQDAVAEATKGKILDYENSYMAAIALSSKSLAEQELFRATACRGITSAMAALERKGMSAEQQNDYLIAKHGIERNRYMAVREALAQDEETFRSEMDAYEADRDAIRNNGKSWIEQQRELDRLAEKYGADLKKDYSGLTQDFVPTNSDEGIDYDRDAVYAAVEAIEKKYTMQGLLDAVKTANEVILAKQYESGLIDKKTFDKVNNMYQFYVPLRGWDETTADEVYAYINTERPVSNAPMKEAHGRKSKADNVLATIFNMGESGIMQGNRNLVKQKFLQMAQDHNTDAISVSDIWVKYNDVSGEWEAVFPQILQNATPEEVRDIVEKFDEKMKVLSKMPNAEVKRESELADVGYKILPKELNEHQVIVKRGGKTYVLTINGNPRAAQALNGLTNPDSPTGIYKLVENTAGKFNRFLAANFTTRNPNFVVSNFLRDAIYSNSTVWVKESPAYAWSFNTNFAKVNPLKMYSLVQRYAKGQLDMNNEIEKAYRDFILNGGETGYTNLRDIDKIKKKIRNELKDANGKVSVRKAFKALGETMDLFNKSVENCARFAAYLTSIEHGRSIDRAVNDAKEISVNFNKKGSGSRFLGAEGETAAGNIASAISGAGRAGYIFWNAGIQGLTNFWTLAKNHRKKFLALAAGNYLLGALMPIIAEATGGDDDDSDYYDLPEYVRRSNICFRNGFGGWVTIPLSVEFRSLYGLGELSSSALIGKEQLSKKQLAIKVAEQISQIMPLDMMEGGGGFSALVPSSIKPIVEASQNKDWTGLPLYKDNDFNKGMPEWTKVFKSTSPALVNMSKYANELSGGDKYTVGAVNFNPANVEHILSGYFGGVATSIFQLVKTAETIFGDREYDPRDIPIVNRVVKRGDERTKKKAIDNQYYENLEEMDKLEQRLKGYKKEATTPTNDIFELAGYQEKLNKLMQSDEYKRYRQAENIKELIKNLSNYSKRGNSDELEDLSYQYKKLLNDIMREKSE